MDENKILYDMDMKETHSLKEWKNLYTKEQLAEKRLEYIQYYLVDDNDELFEGFASLDEAIDYCNGNRDEKITEETDDISVMHGLTDKDEIEGGGRDVWGIYGYNQGTNCTGRDLKNVKNWWNSSWDFRVVTYYQRF